MPIVFFLVLHAMISKRNVMIVFFNAIKMPIAVFVLDLLI